MLRSRRLSAGLFRPLRATPDQALATAGPDTGGAGIAGFAASRGIERARVLEIGGGAGHLQAELLRRGASHVTSLEISHNYEAEAARLLGEAGMTGQVTRRFPGIAQAPGEAGPADVAVLHRAVCYPGYAALLTAAAGHARKTLACSHPAANAINRAQFGTENLCRWLTRNDFRVFIHPPQGMARAAEPGGMTAAFRRHAGVRHIRRGSGSWLAAGLV